VKLGKFIVEGDLENNTTFNGKGAEVSEIIICPKVINNINLIPQNIVIKNYNVKGRVRVVDSNNITFENVTIKSTGSIGFSVEGHSLQTTFKNCTLKGRSNSNGVYIAEQTSHTLLENNTFDIKTKKQTILLDSIKHNKILNNTFVNPTNGAIELREGGNSILNNTFDYKYNNFIAKWIRNKFYPSIKEKLTTRVS
jgi:hypothetical protein